MHYIHHFLSDSYSITIGGNEALGLYAQSSISKQVGQDTKSNNEIMRIPVPGEGDYTLFPNKHSTATLREARRRISLSSPVGSTSDCTLYLGSIYCVMYTVWIATVHQVNESRKWDTNERVRGWNLEQADSKCGY